MLYVDTIRKHKGRLWCHLLTDDENHDNLHEFASKLGLKREWYHNRISNVRTSHYDLYPSKRKKAIAMGAKPISTKEFLNIIKEKSDENPLSSQRKTH